MKRLAIVSALAAAVLCVSTVASAQKMVFVVRHGERADAGMQAQTDPPLSAAGEARAQKLAAMLADAGVKDIFATELKRTQDTAKPLAAKTGVAVERVGSKDTALLIEKIKSHPNDVVLVVGHSNTRLRFSRLSPASMWRLQTASTTTCSSSFLRQER
jgi:phosphohistidine phosphatase SixA